MFIMLYLIGVCISVITFAAMPSPAYLSLGFLVAIILAKKQYRKFAESMAKENISGKWLYLIVFSLDMLLFPSAILWNIHQAYYIHSREQHE